MNSARKTPEDLALISQGLGVTEAFSSWPPALFDSLVRLARLGRYARGDPVHSEAVGEAQILIVVSGSVVVGRVSDNGSGEPFLIIGPAAVAGFSRAMNLNDEARYDYRAHDNAVIVHLRTSALLGVLDAEPFLWESIARKLLRQNSDFFVTASNHLTGDLRRRLAATIVRLAQIYGVDKTTMSVRLRLSQDDLAAMVQASRGAINREMRAFEAMGLVRADYGAVTICDEAALRRFGGGADQPVQRPQRGPAMNPPGNSAADCAIVRQGLLINASFAGWSPVAIDALVRVSHLGRYERGAPVRNDVEGAPEVLVVLSGHLMWSITYPDGVRAPVFIYTPGQVMGIETALTPDVHRFNSYEAHEDAVIVHLPAQVVMDWLDAEPRLWAGLARDILKYQRAVGGTLLDYLTGSTRRRLAATISRLAQVFGVDDDSLSLRLRLSQDDLAAMLQVTRQSINREMRALEEMGVIAAEYGGVTVRQLETLRQLGGTAGGMSPP